MHEKVIAAAGVPPPRRMRLAQALTALLDHHGDEVLLAVPPWSPDAAAVITPLCRDGRLPDALAREGFAFCLGAGVAREVGAALAGTSPSAQDVRALLLHYALHDAYPDAVHARHGGPMR